MISGVNGITNISLGSGGSHTLFIA